MSGGWLEYEFDTWEEAEKCEELLNKLLAEYKAYQEGEDNQDEIITAAVNFCSAWCGD